MDDEPAILAGLTLHLRRHAEVVTATSGAAGLETLQKDGPIAVVVSDMRMPGMDGVAFLSQVRRLAPDSTRLLLTGQVDLDSAIGAVNEGQIFRFLCKPCPSVVFVKAVLAAAEQYRLVTAERVLLEQTLHGSIKALTDVLSLTDPASFGRATRIKQKVSVLAGLLKMRERWQVEVAAMLSQLGYITLPTETVEKLHQGGALTEREKVMVDRLPVVTEQLLGSIPRMEVVRGILAAQTKAFRPVEGGQEDGPRQLIARGAQMLRLALDLDAMEARGVTTEEALERMRGHKGSYDPEILAALAAHHAVTRSREVRELAIAGLTLQMILAEDVRMVNGALLLARGSEVTPSFLERIGNFRAGTVREPIRVIVPG